MSIPTFALSIDPKKREVPFIEKENGTFLIDSYKIMQWLDEEYPSKPCIYLPEATHPVDVHSPEYLAVMDTLPAFINSQHTQIHQFISF